LAEDYFPPRLGKVKPFLPRSHACHARLTLMDPRRVLTRKFHCDN